MVGLLSLLFLLPRLYFLFTYPPYTDESLYVRWGLIATQNVHALFLPLSGAGKQPLLFWLFGIAARLSSDPVTGARFVSLLFGSAGGVLMYLTARRVYGRPAAVWTVIMYALSPVCILHDATVLLDGPLLTVTLGMLYTALKAAERPVFWVSAQLGALIALGLWIKTNGAIPALFSLFLPIVLSGRDKNRRKRAVSSACLSLVVAVVLISPLLFHPQVSRLAAESGLHTLTVKELRKFPFRIWWMNLMTFSVTFSLYTSVLMPVAVASGCIGLAKNRRYGIAGFGAACLAAVLLTVRSVFARYYLFAFASLLPVAGSGIARMWEKNLPGRLSVILFTGLLACGSALFLFDRQRYFALFPDWPAIHERDYVSGWTAGDAVLQAYRSLESRRLPGHMLILAVPDIPGNPSDYLLARYFRSGRTPVYLVSTPQQMQDFRLSVAGPAIYITRQSLLSSGMLQYLSESARFPSPGGQDAVVVYTIQ